MDLEEYIEKHREELEEEFLSLVCDEWSCKDEGVDLLESNRFTDYCEDKYNEDRV